jgi:hypothetical protein
MQLLRQTLSQLNAGAELRLSILNSFLNGFFDPALMTSRGTTWEQVGAGNIKLFGAGGIFDPLVYGDLPQDAYVFLQVSAFGASFNIANDIDPQVYSTVFMSATGFFPIMLAKEAVNNNATITVDSGNVTVNAYILDMG